MSTWPSLRDALRAQRAQLENKKKAKSREERMRERVETKTHGRPPPFRLIPLGTTCFLFGAAHDGAFLFESPSRLLVFPFSPSSFFFLSFLSCFICRNSWRRGYFEILSESMNVNNGVFSLIWPSSNSRASTKR